LIKEHCFTHDKHRLCVRKQKYVKRNFASNNGKHAFVVTNEDKIATHKQPNGKVFAAMHSTKERQ